MTIDLSNTLFPDWIPPRYPKWIRRMGGDKKRAWAHLWSFAARTAGQAETDGLDQLVPIIVVTGKSPRELRREMGRATWRAIHHATPATNAKRAMIRRRSNMAWADIVAIRPTHLYRFMSANPWSGGPDLEAAFYAGINAKPGQFAHVRMLWADTVRMGGYPRAAWSVKRLIRELDRLARKVALAQADPTPFAEPLTIEAATRTGSFRFERLVSGADMALEGITMRHCIASYAESAASGDVAVFRIDGSERATYAFSTGGKRPTWSELKGFANSRPGPALCDAAREVRKAFLAREKQP